MEEALAGSPDLAAAAARLRAAEGFAQRAGAALKPTDRRLRRRPTCRSSARTRTRPRRPFPTAGTIAAASGIGFSLDLDLWGKNRAASRAANARRRRSALRVRRSAAGADHRHRFDLCRAGVALRAARQPRVCARDPHARRAKLVKQRVDIGLDTLAEQKQAEARMSPGPRRHRSDRRSDRADQERACRARRRRAGPRADHRPARRSRCCRRRAFPPMPRSTWSAAGRTSPRSRSRVEAAAAAHQGSARRLLSERQSDAL